MSNETSASVESFEKSGIALALSKVYEVQAEAGKTPHEEYYALAHARKIEALKMRDAHIKTYDGN